MKEDSIQIKLPNALLQGIYSCLDEIISKESYSDKAVANLLKSQTAWGSRDRRTATAIIYDANRNSIRYQYLYQLLKFKETEVTEIQFLVAIAMLENEALSSRVIIQEEILSKLPSKEELPAHIQHSVQAWIYETVLKDWGEQTDDILNQLDQPAKVYVRYNTLKTGGMAFSKILDKLKLEYVFHPTVSKAVEIKSRNQIRKSPAFKHGLFEFQDISSQYVIQKCEVKPESTVVDYCAGKGGKTLQLASLMKNTGRLIATDVDTSRLIHLKRRAQKAGVQNLEIVSNREIQTYQELQADLVLIDAPCTGIGTLKRQADIKFRLEEKELKELVSTQAEILRDASKLVKISGKLAYATCSILKDENEKQIERFLEAHSNFQLESEEYILPEQLDGDGFYLAILKKTSKDII